MDRFIIIRLVLFLTSLVLIRCQSMHLCEALERNNGRIGYTLSVPNGNSHKKFIVIKDHYWELEYKPSGAKQVELKDLYSKQSDWLSGDYQLAFAVRFGTREKTVWTQTVIGLVNTNTQTVDWSLFPVQIDDLTPKGEAKKSSFATNFNDFKPTIAFKAYSQPESNTIVFIEQNWKSKKLSNRIQVLNTTDPSKGWDIDTNSTKPKGKRLPPAIYKISGFYTIKGFFGVSLSGSDPNGTIALLEFCDGAPLGDNLCSGATTYHFCVSAESVDDPVKSECHPASVSLAPKRLIDCSAETWTTISPQDLKTESVSDGVFAGKPALYGGDSARTGGSVDSSSPTGSTENKNENKEGSLWWLWLLIGLIGLIIIIVIVVLFCCFCTKKTDESMDGEPVPSSLSKVSAGGTPRSDVVTLAPGSSKTGSVTGASKTGSVTGHPNLMARSVRSEII